VVRARAPGAGRRGLAPPGAIERATRGTERRVLNPLRSEAEAFRLLVWVVLVAAVVIALVLLLRAV
jgi:hypothetical protein